MREQTEFAQTLVGLHDELAEAPSAEQLRSIGARLSDLGYAIALACERAYLELTEHLDVA
jgi:hypothetical protein